MLTPHDLESDTNISGYKYVVRAGGLSGYQASRNGGGRRDGWRGPLRKTALDAARDYCNYMNGNAVVTIEDIRNPSRQSGFEHVGNATTKGRTTRYRAQVGGTAANAWRGPSRKTAEEAAQDYCDYVNGQAQAPPATQSYPAPTIDMGNITEHQPKRTGGRAPKLVEGPRDLYDVFFYDPDTGLVVRRKVGYTARGLNRYTGICRMLGLSMKPNAQPRTLPSERDAKVAEDALIADICKDKNWKRVGKECFAPTRKVKA
jgi:hypothetical protein